ncbi:vitamin K epoxide reductase family protein [Rhodococcus sp. MEB064]|uniref:vitamin K epoxide reductase family protein n=1 Tax=Rhodococcus sp. MEB064 TaxID=1587522 RepID=UPI0005AD1181|nr:vitamin K epoxide reductase family protein [Rhodococcus sp. MEB064]KIQ20774.1 Vitamin K epoxide reductase [Rhodococcus sp. MEB064]
MNTTLSDGETEAGTIRRAPALAWVMLIGGVIGFAAAVVLTVDKLRLIADSSYAPSCNINAVVNCGSVMESAQASVLGFPNSFMGVGGFAIVAMIGAALVLGVHLERWFWVAVQVGVTAAVLFVHWLIVQSLYRIGALCPYCMVVWAVTVPVFWYVTLHNVALFRPTRRPVSSAWHRVPVAVWFVVVAALVAQRFVLTSD